MDQRGSTQFEWLIAISLALTMMAGFHEITRYMSEKREKDLKEFIHEWNRLGRESS